MRILILNDGTKHEIYRCGAADNVLWIGLTGETEMIPVINAFSDPEKTEKLTSTYDSEGAHTTVYEGYTNLTIVQKQKDGILIALRYAQKEAGA